jgi:ABC-2 type transport system permease protein
MYARALTWWTILRINLEERLVYRGDFALGTLMRFLPIITQIFLWTAVFNAIGNREIAGYTRNDMVAYYLLTMLSRAFSSMPGLASGIAYSIREGEIKKYLIQPIDMVGFLFLSRIAHKIAYYSVATVPFAIVYTICAWLGFFEGWPQPLVPTMAAFIASLLMAFLLGFFLEAAIGMLAFWWLEVSSLLFVYMLLNFFLSGHMFPIDMLDSPNVPWIFATLVRLTPLQYLAYFPSAVFLQKITGWELVQGLCIQAGWVLTCILACRMMFHYGVKRYSGFGG